MLEDEMLTIEDLAAYLKLKPQTIYKWAQTGKIPGAKIGKEWRFRRSAIERWIESSLPSDRTSAPAGNARKADGHDGDGEAVLGPSSGKAVTGKPRRAGRGAAKTKKAAKKKGASRVRKLQGPEGN